MATAFDHRSFLASLTHRPGVYRMIGSGQSVLYVGKAKDLRKRVSTYFGSKAHQPKTQALMRLTERVEVTVTSTEQEALLLEYNLIKAHRPRFNVVLRDDKSYPWIHVSTQQDYPRFEFHRGARRGGGRYLGPWPNAGAVRQSLADLQKLFRVRQCTDTFFANRTRPCLQHQIGRCSAPCVGLVTAEDYRRDVDDAILFLQGRNETILANLADRMERASAAREYERAAALRDQIKLIRGLQAEQVVTGRGVPDADVVGVSIQSGQACVALLLIRGSRVLGSRSWFPELGAESDAEEVVAAFIAQHYLRETPPPEILLPLALEDRAVLEAALSPATGQPVHILDRVRGTRRRWLEMAATNAAQGLATRLATSSSLRQQTAQLAQVLGLDEPPARIECFDVSHTSGRETVAACVAFGPDGPIRSDYRRYNIREVEAGDDYAAIAQAVERRYAPTRTGGGVLPDLVLIDGGRGQVERAHAVLEELQLGDVQLVGVAKGPARRAGDEQIIRPGSPRPLVLGRESAALHLIQQVRDEAHRFAITGHRQRRAKARVTSALESIAGLGPARRRALLRQFGGLQGVRRAGVADLARVPGISRVLAERIYDHLHGGPA